MIFTIKQAPDKKFTDKMDQTRFIKDNIKGLTAAKKSEYKTKSEPVLKSELFTNAFVPVIENITGDIIEVKTVINTTNVIDSHMDLHLRGIWNKTVKDNPYSHHLKQHENKFESVISNRAKSFNDEMNFKDLGVNYDFLMDANINLFLIDRLKDPFMFGKYADGMVTEHSIGMLYVDLDLAYYDEDSQKEMDFFNDALKLAINPEVAEERGYVWLIREAKKREGSAVVFGSNSITPTLYVKNYEPQSSTYKLEPPKSTLQQKSTDYLSFSPNLI